MEPSKALLQQVRDAYSDRIIEKHEYLSKHADIFVRRHFSDDQYDGIISGLQITDIINNYLIDIHRFKERRDMIAARPDGTDSLTSWGKVAAFTTKWIIKLKPICIVPKIEKEASSEDRFLCKYVNELFAIEHSEHMLQKAMGIKLYSELACDFRQKKLSETQLYMTYEQLIGFYGNT